MGDLESVSDTCLRWVLKAEPPAQNEWAGGSLRPLVMQLVVLGEGLALHVEAVAR